MKLVSFSVENYRSITKARKVGVSDYTILIGPNNEGKSNILRALALAMETLVDWSSSRPMQRGGILSLLPQQSLFSRIQQQSFKTRKSIYNWVNDFPINLQKKKPDGTTNITLEFELTEEEVKEFEAVIGSKLNGTLPIQFSFGNSPPTVGIVKQGKGSKPLNQKTEKIAQFISLRIHFEYIPAIRTSENALEIITGIVYRELKLLEKNTEYKEATEKIKTLQDPVLSKLSDNIAGTISKFLPNVKSVELKHEFSSNYNPVFGRIVVSVDDGVLTPLERKGDGVQSLVALALMQHASERPGMGDYVFAIEEPEAHLHPEACHALREIISNLSKDQQVVLASHSPIFVNRTCVTNNIIVTGSRAKPADNIAEIRKSLGVKISDNLKNAELVLLCEGKEDKVCLEAILAHRSEKIRDAIKLGRFIIEGVGGAGNLSYKAGTYLGDLCRIHCFLDDDKAGRKECQRTLDDHNLKTADFNLAIYPGLSESELEDLFDRKIYYSAVKEEFGVDINVGKLTGKQTKEKWSSRMKFLFKKQGKQWDRRIETELKNKVAQCVLNNPQKAIQSQAETIFDALVIALEQKLYASLSIPVSPANKNHPTPPTHSPLAFPQPAVL